jgi:thiosulfate dehydrogenase [quinone] large subunit
MELDRSLAHAILRVALGLNLLVHGSVRIPALGKFVDGLVRDFSVTILPTPLVRAFALGLPFAEILIGALLIAGLWQRAVLVAGSLVMVALVFGTALQQKWDILTQQMIYVLIYSLLLATRSWDRWSLDARRKSGRPGSTG